MTHSEENYLKTIFHLATAYDGAVSTNAIADKMETKPSSVTDMIKKLAEKGWVHYKRYQGVVLTEAGTVLALQIVRKHRLWEVFLVEKLNFAWDEVHEIAEQLEHIKSEKLIDRLDTLLGHPKYDPHGDPIPTKEGELYQRDKIVLSDMPLTASGICIGVKDTSKPFLKYLDKHQIVLGDTITLLEKEEYDGSLRVEINNKPLHISQRIASNLFVKSIAND